MQSKLSDLVDNLSGINNKECKSCIEKKEIKSECDFIGFNNKRLNYRCKECGKKFTKSINEAIMHKFCNGDLDLFFVKKRCL